MANNNFQLSFTFDDGLISQRRFWNEVQKPATYFILPEATEAKSRFGKQFVSGTCKWNEVRGLAQNGEIGYHGFSTTYNKFGAEKTIERTNFGLDLISVNTGIKPVSFAYTNMIPAQLGVISKMFPYIRDYFWKDLKKGEKEQYAFRVDEKDVPEKMREYRKKIFCVHLGRDPLNQLKRLTKIKNDGYEYCVIILHELDDELIYVSKIISNAYDCITFREIFEGRSVGNTVDKTTNTGSTPVVSPEKKK